MCIAQIAATLSASIIAASIVALPPQCAKAGTYRLMLESRTDAGSGQEIYLATFNSFADLLSATASSNGFSLLDIQPAFSVVGLTYDGAYRPTTPCLAAV
jgi:hypothetical protein